MKVVPKKKRLEVYKAVLNESINVGFKSGICLLLSEEIFCDWREVGNYLPEIKRYLIPPTEYSLNGKVKVLRFKKLYDGVDGDTVKLWRKKVLKEIIKKMESC